MMDKIKFFKKCTSPGVAVLTVVFFAGQLLAQQDPPPIQDTTSIQDTTEINETVQQQRETQSQEQSTSQLYETGLRQLQSGYALEAATTFESILQKDPDNVDARIYLARAYHDLKQFDKADSAIEKAITNDSSNANAYLVRGIIKSSTDNNEEAVSSYKKSINLNQNDNPFAYNNLALIYIKDGDYSHAIPLLEKATQQRNDIVYFHNNLGVAYEAHGDLEQAREAFNQALTVDPAYDKAATNLARVEESLGESASQPDSVEATARKQ